MIKQLVLALALLQPIENLDWAVQRAVQSMRHPALEGPMKALTNSGKHKHVLAVMLAIAIFDRTAGVATIRRALVVLIPVNLTVEGLKRAFNRTRPDGDRNGSNASFPSSHAANAFALAAVFARRWRRLAIPFMVLAGAIAFSRMYLDRHFLTDVVAGAAIGWFFAWAVSRWLMKDAPVPEAAAEAGRLR